MEVGVSSRSGPQCNQLSRLFVKWLVMIILLTPTAAIQAQWSHQSGFRFADKLRVISLLAADLAIADG
jgi:hypothetical protein